MHEEVVIEVAGEVEISIEEVASTTRVVMPEVAMGRTVDGAMRVAEGVKEAAIRTTGAAQIIEEGIMLATGSTRRMRRQTVLLQMATTILPSLAARNNMTLTPSLRSCHTCLHRAAYSQWPHMQII